MTIDGMNNTMTLKDGRTLGYAEYGDSAGTPIFYVHGGGSGSRLLARPLETVATELKCRIIAPDRPGIGLSDFQPGRTILDWSADVCELADALEIQQFAVFSESGGSPYVTACAFRIPERLSAAAIVAGICPLEAPGVTEGMSKQQRTMASLVQKAPLWFLRGMLRLQVGMIRKRPEKFLAEMLKSLPDADRTVMQDSELQPIMIEGLLEAFRQGTHGPARDLKLVMRPWGFGLDEISKSIHLWHGEADQNAPLAMARYLKQMLPKSQVTYYPQEGHISVLHNHAREILASLAMPK